MGNLSIYAAPLPFSNHQVRLTAPLGSSIQQIVDHIAPKEYGDLIIAVALLDGIPIPEEAWVTTFPLPEQNLVINIVPGKGGGKNPLSTILSIAVLIAAPQFAAWATAQAAMAGVTSLTGSMIVNGLARVAFSVVGSLLVNALAPPPKPSNLGTTSNPASSPTQFIEGARNAISPYGVVPICLGTNRMFPPLASRSFTEAIDNDQYVRQLFTWGYGNKLLVRDFKIGETDISEFTDLELEHRLNGDLNQGANLFPNDPYQEDFSVLLEQSAGYTLRTTQLNADEAVVDFTFPQGLTEFNTAGNQVKRRVQLELQYAPTGTSNWTPAANAFSAKSGASFNMATSYPLRSTVTSVFVQGSGYRYVGYRKDIIVIDNYSGAISVITGPGPYATQAGVREPTLPANSVRLASIIMKGESTWVNKNITSTVVSLTDERAAANIGSVFQNSGSFAPSLATNTVTIAAGGLSVNQLNFNQAQTEALRKSIRVKFPSRGQYDIRVRRLTADTNTDKIFDKVYLSAIKSFTYRNPVIPDALNGTAARIKGTDQLNGSLDEFNAIVSAIIPDYDVDSDSWVERVSSNPASIYRYVLQGPANARPLSDDEIDIGAIEQWHIYCQERGYTYDRVIDYETSVADVLADIASAGAASPDIVDGKRTVVVDQPKDDIIQVATPRNSWGYSGEMTYVETPHAFRVTFRNASKGYQNDERIVYADGYDENNATMFETLEYQSCTSADLAYKHARRFLATVLLRPETHQFMMDVEHLVALRGNRIKFNHDVPVVGVGDGRVKQILDDGNSPAQCTGIILDDAITIPATATYYLRARLEDGSILYKQLFTTVGETNILTFAEPFSIDDAPQVGSLVWVFEAGGEVDLIITKIEPQSDLTARITAVDYAPGIFTADTETIPPFNSNITTPLELMRPEPPTLLNIQSDESVMLRNSDGSYTTRLVMTIENSNEGFIEPVVSVRVTGSTVFTPVNVLEANSERVILTGLEDSVNYDIHVRYRRRGSTQLSLPLQVNNYKFEGASAAPHDVTGFEVNINGDLAIFKWEPNEDIDISHYKIRFSRLYSGATWATAQVVEDYIVTNRISAPFEGGTYLIKAVDIRGNESVNATSIITYNPGQIRNVVETLTENPLFEGAKDNTVVENSAIVLQSDTDDGYYYFRDTIDLGEIFTAYRSATLIANGVYINNLFDIDDLFAVDDLFGAGSGDLFAVDDLFALTDMFGIGEGAWEVQLQSRLTTNAPFIPDETLLSFPNDLSNAAWSKNDGSIVADATLAPDGSMTADLFVPNTSTTSHSIIRDYAQVGTPTPYSAKFYVKAETYRYMRLAAYDNSDSTHQANVFVDALTGDFTDSVGGSFSNVAASVEDIGGGWFMVDLSFTTNNATTLRLRFYNTVSLGGTATLAGDGTSGIYYWGLSLIEGLAPHSADWTDWAEFTAGNEQFRSEQYRLFMRSLQPGISPSVPTLGVTIDMPDRVIAQNDLVVPVTGLRIDFTPPLKKLDGLAIVAQDLATGDYYEVTNKDENGFDIAFFNAAGTPIERTFDYVAKGYGRVIS